MKIENSKMVKRWLRMDKHYQLIVSLRSEVLVTHLLSKMV